MNIATVGMFDGVHRGHRAIIGCLAERGRQAGLVPAVLTFREHPLAALNPAGCPERLVTGPRRRELLLQAGAGEVRELDFREIRSLTAADFLSRLRSAGTRGLVMGFNNHIGSDRLSAAQADALGIIPVTAVPELPHPAGVSSSAIRAALGSGDVAAAADMLGRLYCVEGRVVAGKHLGRTIGFPTANIGAIATMLPADGVYAVDVRLPGMETKRGMANIGTRPTFDDGDRRTLEVNIFDFDENIYGRDIEFCFIARLRDERRFAGPDELRRSLEADRLASINTSYPVLAL